MKRRLLLPLALTVLLGAGCTFTKQASIPFAGLPGQVSLEPLDRGEYQVGKAVEGRSCATSVALWPLPIWWTTSDVEGTFVWSFASAAGLAERGAVWVAMENAPLADFLTAPRVHREAAVVGPWFKNICYHLEARTARLKRDDELPPRKVEVDLEVKDTGSPGDTPTPPPLVVPRGD